MGQQVTGHVHGVDQEFAVFDGDVYVGAEGEQLPGQILRFPAGADHALGRRHLRRQPGGKGVRPGRGDTQIVSGGQLGHAAPDSDQFVSRFGRRAAHFRADLDDRLAHLRPEFELAQDAMILLQALGDIRPQLARLGVNDLVLFFNANSQRWGLHHSYLFCTTYVGTDDPPPEVTFNNGSVPSLVRQPSMYTP